MSPAEAAVDDLFPQPHHRAPEQLPLALPMTDRMRAEDFLVARCNRVAHALLARWPEGQDPVLVLTGAPGSGKTHLARIWAERRSGLWLEAAGLAEPPAAWAEAACWVVDDGERCSDETFLFHLVNLARAEGRGLVVTSAFPVAVWRPRLPDLRSRLLAAPTVAIDPIDDALLAAVLVKQLADRQLRVGPQVVHYLVARMERSFVAARRLVALLDALALARRRPITTALARDALQRLGHSLHDDHEREETTPWT